MFNSVKTGIAPHHSKNGLAPYFPDAWVHFVSTFFLFFSVLGALVAPGALLFDSTISTAAEKTVDAGGCRCAANQRRRATGVELAVPEIYFCDL